MGEMTRREKWVMRENKWNGQEVKGGRRQVGERVDGNKGGWSRVRG